MHLAEGVLPGPMLAAGAGLAAAGCAVGLRRMDMEHLMTCALLSAAFFTASLIHVPIGPGNVHLILSGLMAAVLGWAAVPAILVALFLQALFFQFGGFTVLGVNTVVMAAPALALALVLRPRLARPQSRTWAAFVMGAGPVLGSALLLALVLTVTDSRFVPTAAVILAAHLPVAVVEGMVTVFTVSFILRVQPEILHLEDVS